MKLTNLSLLVLSASIINARFVEQHEKDQVVIHGDAVDNERYLIELSPGKTQWVTEEEKWELRRVGRSYSNRLLVSLIIRHRMVKTSWTSQRRLSSAHFEQPR
jgi:hypothetical protein